MSVISCNLAAESLNLNLGKMLSEAEISLYDITIFPDGRNLPPGAGTAPQGNKLYKAQCSHCHGARGIEGPAARLAGSSGWFSFTDPLRILRIKEFPILLISVGDLWPHATSVFDYIRRAMPHYAPKSLSNEQVYSLTAYILYLNDIIKNEDIVNQKTLPKIVMPAQQRSVTAW